MSSFQTQYGIRLSRELSGMKWDEFTDLLSGIGPDTPLGRIVSIRAEEDKDVLKHFTPGMKKIRSEWRNKRAKKVPQEQVGEYLEAIKQAFIKMAGEVDGGDKN